MSNIIENIRKGDIDINNQDLFFSILIKGLLNKLDDKVTIRNKQVPHFILHTGDDTMYLNMKEFSYTTTLDEFNEKNIYNIIPRCIVNPTSINLNGDQLSSPYSSGKLQFETENVIYSLSGEFRRMPVKLICDIKYYMDSFTDMLALIQQVISKLSFIQTFYITYMGQIIKCSYRIPDDFDGEKLMDIDGTTTDGKLKTISLSLEIETTYPVWNPNTIVNNDQMIYNFTNTIKLK